jgi:hypothetical protein
VEEKIKVIKLKSGNFIICKEEPGIFKDTYVLGFQQNGVGFASLAQPFTDKPVDISVEAFKDDIFLDITEFIPEESKKAVFDAYTGFVTKNKTGLITNINGIKL